ncbi:hypothetical protein Vadar_000661 [Vaccinium darrowii]|uniref:Uncharacterized protein n=1 Tax=Vaccinium darrowii TaxID=229202 RepID=A0ACB7X6N8_9ERIC|nr:hypothetical protein Vadar_000661 [Vaccinium darrowii]
MEGGPPTPVDRKVITLKVLVDKAKNRVIFAEADYEFVDILLSFLTLPIGTVVRLLDSDSTSIGSLTTMYKSVSSLESRRLRTNYCQEMLLNPRNASETECSKLKINVYPLEPAKLYRCELRRVREKLVSCSIGWDRWFSTFKDRECPRCKYRMSLLAKVEDLEDDKAIEGGDGVFVKDGISRFMITDDLQVMEASTGACISLLQKLGINDGNEVEESHFVFDTQEVIRLLKFALLSKSALTEAILDVHCSSKKESVKFQPKRTPQPDKNASASNTNNMTLKLWVSKSEKKVLYAEAGVDVVDFLFSTLTYPLGSIIRLLGKKSGFGCVDNLYKSAEDLINGGYLKSEGCTKMLVCPKLAPFHSVDNQLLQIEEVSYPQYVFDSNQNLWVVAVAKTELSSPTTEESEERRFSAVVMDPKSPTGEVDSGKGYMKGPATYMILNDLSVAPLSPIKSVALVNQMNVPLSDVVERVVTIGHNEALNLLNASLISKTVLSDVFN